jgi:hypothetical protein
MQFRISIYLVMFGVCTAGARAQGPATKQSGQGRHSHGTMQPRATGGGPLPIAKVATFYQGSWYFDKNGNLNWDGTTADRMGGFGVAGDVPVRGDWTGTGVVRVGVFRSGTWLLDLDDDLIWDGPIEDMQGAFGVAGQVPVVGDWNGDGKCEIGVFDPGASAWYLDWNGNGQYDGPVVDKLGYFGASGFTPVVGDWNGDGKTDIGAYNPANGAWYLDANGNYNWDGMPADRFGFFGAAGFTPVVGDWTGDGRAKVGVYNSANAAWYLDANNNLNWDGTPADRSGLYGAPGYVPFVGDWLGDGIARAGVFDAANGVWCLDLNGNLVWDGTPADGRGVFGTSGMTLIPDRWQSYGGGPPDISNIQVTNITTTSATITWNTNVAANSQVFYGTTANNYASWTMLNPTPLMNHIQYLPDLNPGITYHFKVQSGSASRLDFTFTTPLTPPPVPSDFKSCASLNGAGSACTLAPGTYSVTNVTGPVMIERSNVTVRGLGTGGSASSNRLQTKLVRDPTFTGPIIRVDVATPATGVILENLTVCGGIYTIRDWATIPHSDLTFGPSPVGCPRIGQTTCGDMVYRLTRSQEPPFTPPLPTDGSCVDLEVAQADNGSYDNNPFGSSPGTYALTVSNVAFEDATGHSISLYANRYVAGKTPSPDKKLNGVYIHDSAINFSAVTGILYGANGVHYENKFCDNYFAKEGQEFRQDSRLFAPRNIRVENNVFSSNNTGAMGGGATRWFGLRNNTFTNNYIHPQMGNDGGGTVQMDGCADKVEISGNIMSGPSSYAGTDGLELYGRYITVTGNNISGYGVEGVGAHSLFQSTIEANHVQDNGWAAESGGIKVVTSFAPGPCDSVPRDTDYVTIGGNTPNNPLGQTQAYGIHFADQERPSSSRVSSVTVSADRTPYRVTPVFLDRFVGLYNYLPAGGYSLQNPRNPAENPPRALSVDVSPSFGHDLWPVPPRCSDTFDNPPGTTKGYKRVVFRFGASDLNGASNVAAIHGVFSLGGDDKNGSGGPSGSGMCHFAYDPVANLVFLDDANAGSTWPLFSAVGNGGSDIGGPGSANPNCTIHALSSSSWKTDPPSQAQPMEYVAEVKLDVEFPASPTSKYHIYTYNQNCADPSQFSIGDNNSLWKYWGYWWNVE